MKNNLRLCEVNGELGYFHTWATVSYPIEPSPMIGGHPGGIVSSVYGVVEFPDRVDYVDPRKMKFQDEISYTLYSMNKKHQERKNNKELDYANVSKAVATALRSGNATKLESPCSFN